MKISLILILTVTFITTVSSQDTERIIKYVPINLKDSVNEKKVLAYTIGQRAIVYFRESAIKRLAKESKQFLTVKSLDSLFSKSDTVKFNIFSNATSSSFDKNIYILLSNELFNGSVKVYLKSKDVFTQNIYYYLVDDELMTHIFYCLPDKVPFYIGLFSIHTAGKLRFAKPKRNKHKLVTLDCSNWGGTEQQWAICVSS